MSHHNYPNRHEGPLRPSYTGTNSHRGSLYPEQGRTILPPLTIAFPTSDSLGSLFYDVPAHPAPSPVPYYVPPETQEPTIKKKRKRADARQLEALDRMYTRTAFPSTEERQQLARDLDMSARSVQIWLAHSLFTLHI